MPNDKKPSVSILLPTYNGSIHLREQIESILAQTLSDFELVIVDDGSTDDSATICGDYRRRDRRVRILESAGNRGQKARLVELAGAARAPLIAFSDQDDIWHPEKLALLRDGLGDRGLAFGRSELVDGTGKQLGRTLTENFGPLPAPGDRLRLLFVPRISGHALVVRREIVTDMAFRRFQPFDWLIGLDALFSTGVAYVHDAIVYHRLHGGNQCNASVEQEIRGLQRLRPGRIYAELQSTRRRRFNFLERIEHLGFSPIIDEEARLMFSRAADRCRAAWLQPGDTIPFSDSKLREFLLDSLKPWAGTEEDWAVAVDHVTGLSKSQFHPRTLYQSAKTLFWY
jgi:glycosyltransferase involved in cell wall biosynthesis